MRASVPSCRLEFLHRVHIGAVCHGHGLRGLVNAWHGIGLGLGLGLAHDTAHGLLDQVAVGPLGPCCGAIYRIAPHSR